MREITATMRQLLDQIGLSTPARQNPPPTLTLRRPRMNDEPSDEFDHEQTLQQVLLHLLTTEADDLEELCEAAGIPTLTDTAGVPVYLTSVRSYEDAGIMTLDKGVWIELSDGSQFGYTITVGRRPTS
jgi:hypothetical protein